jgi:hypothetical protein
MPLHVEILYNEYQSWPPLRWPRCWPCWLVTLVILAQAGLVDGGSAELPPERRLRAQLPAEGKEP